MEKILNQIPWKQYNQAHAHSTGKGTAPPGGLGDTVFISACHQKREGIDLGGQPAVS